MSNLKLKKEIEDFLKLEEPINILEDLENIVVHIDKLVGHQNDSFYIKSYKSGHSELVLTYILEKKFYIVEVDIKDGKVTLVNC